PDAVVDFDEPAVVSLWTSLGHTALWIAVGRSIEFDFEELLEDLAEGRPIVRTELQWHRLLFRSHQSRR
ncbi:MAG: hypothetical protein ACYTG0_19895, partial [Planctomycetota bacterium]